ncbi:Uncharacterised protein [Haploplasma axanthum]|uniref:Uncharacterized protein n=2 Tax=Haploplasma axanthum TaxID=29552 RepID=A0A449BDR6_HAPAX|nr:Uncharacterised protein [Haploplasma axanthum]
MWTGTYEDAFNGEVKKSIDLFISNNKDLESFFGVSVHNRKDGFSYFIGNIDAVGTDEYVLNSGNYYTELVDSTEVFLMYQEIERKILNGSLNIKPIEIAEKFDRLPVKVEKYSISKDGNYKVVEIQIPVE